MVQCVDRVVVFALRRGVRRAPARRVVLRQCRVVNVGKQRSIPSNPSWIRPCPDSPSNTKRVHYTATRRGRLALAPEKGDNLQTRVSLLRTVQTKFALR